MTLRLIKTIGGSNGSPCNCEGCGSIHFIKTGNAWHCGLCGLYIPTVFTLREDIKQAVEALDRLKELTNELEQDFKD